MRRHARIEGPAGVVHAWTRWHFFGVRRHVLLVASVAACRPTTAPAVSVEVVVQVDAAHDPVVIFEEETFALVWMDAPLYRDPQGEPVRLFDLDRPREQSPGLHWTVRVHERHGSWLRVGSVRKWLEGGEPIHCIESNLFRSHAVDPELWVHVDDLVPVIAETMTRTFEDGTDVTLLPGVPVVDGQPWVEGYWLPVDPKGLTSVLYRPKPSMPWVDGTQSFVVNDPKPTLNTKTVRYTGEPRGYGRSDPGASDFVAMRGKLMEVARCGRVHMRLDVPPDSKGVGTARVFGKLCEKSESIATLPKGTPLSWPDGREAGRMADALVRMDIDPSTSQRTCFDPQPNAARGASRTEHVLELCVDTSAIAFGNTRCQSNLRDVFVEDVDQSVAD